MHEIDIGVGLQKIAPHALARVRLAGNQQNLQFVAHALDRQHRLVVDRGQFVRQGLDLDLNDILAAMVDLDRNTKAFPGRRDDGRDGIAVAANLEQRRDPAVPAVSVTRNSIV